MKLILDSELIKIPITDNKEDLVNVKSIIKNIVIRPPSYLSEEGNTTGFLRFSVVQKLIKANDLLPNKYKFMLRCGYRPINAQIKRYNWMYNKIKRDHPEWNNAKVKELTDKWIAPPEIVPPHTTGGAFDITIIKNDYRHLDMGTRLGEFNKKTSTYSKYITKENKMNRRLLINILEKVGFVNYPTEWWHWSYGDRYWAAVRNVRLSIYNSI